MGSVYLVRHAQASFGSENYDRLSPLGEEQARVAGAYFDGLEGGITRIVSGTLSRQRRTAQIIVEALNDRGKSPPPLEIDARLDELDLDVQTAHVLPALADPDGELRSLAAEATTSSRSYQKLIRRVFEAWLSAPATADAPSLETWDRFEQRVREALRDVVRAGGRGGRVVVVSSGAVIAAMTRQVLGLPPSAVYPLFEAMRNASITHLLYNGERVSLSSFNDCSYLSVACPAEARGRLVTYR